MLNILKQFSEQLISPDLFIRKRYATFQELLECDRRCHNLLAELETIYYSATAVDINRIRELFADFSAGVREMLAGLHQLAPGRYKNLIDYYKKFDFYARFALAPPKCETTPPYILPLDAAYTDDRGTGGKGLHLSQLVHELHLPVPAGFIISTSAWNAVLEKNGLRPKIDRLLARTDIHSHSSLKETSATLSESIRQAELPEEVADEIAAAVTSLAAKFPDQVFAVRSSAVGEDSFLSFAGQYSSFLNIEKNEIIEAYRQVLASKYSPEAIMYRIIKGLDDEETPMAVIVLIMVDARISGVITTGNPALPDESTFLVHSVYGLGDELMAGRATPSTQEIHQGRGSAIIRHSPDKAEEELSDDKLRLLAGWAEKIAGFYNEPQEIEWSCDMGGKLFLLQARRLKLERNRAEKRNPDLEHLFLLFEGGATASPGICCGPAYKPETISDRSTIPHGSILVCEVTPPSLVTILPQLSGVIARYGSTADHFSSVAREFGIPVLVQTGENCLCLQDGESLTLWADKRSVFRGSVPLADDSLDKLQQTQGNPFFRTLKMVIDFTSPLALVDPSSPAFRPENCRSLHDILRFIHEKSVQAMFIHSTDSLFRKPKGKRLQTNVPLQMYIIDVDDGLSREAAGKEDVSVADLRSLPLQALWRGLTHPGVKWRNRSHFDWQSYDSIALAGGVATKSDSALASFCLISSEYLNVNIRFGYHFTLLDCLCGDDPEENYILMRFAGGGGDSRGRELRLNFIVKVLEKLDFTCEQTGELLDARLMRYDKRITADRLDQVGRLLGAVRLLDMVLNDESMLKEMIENFFRGNYDFSNE